MTINLYIFQNSPISSPRPPNLSTHPNLGPHHQNGERSLLFSPVSPCESRQVFCENHMDSKTPFVLQSPTGNSSGDQKPRRLRRPYDHIVREAQPYSPPGGRTRTTPPQTRECMDAKVSSKRKILSYDQNSVE